KTVPVAHVAIDEWRPIDSEQTERCDNHHHDCRSEDADRPNETQSNTSSATTRAGREGSDHECSVEGRATTRCCAAPTLPFAFRVVLGSRSWSGSWLLRYSPCCSWRR